MRRIVACVTLGLLALLLGGQAVAVWNIEPVDAPRYFEAWYPKKAMAWNKKGTVYLAYGEDHLYLAKKTSGSLTWIVEKVDAASGTGMYPSLALSGAGVHISYHDSLGGDLKYAFFDGIAWQIETVDTQGQTGLWTAIDLDSQGNPHISYYNKTDEVLKYARHDGTGWTTEVVDVSGDVGWYSSIAIDSADFPHISYFDNTLNDLRYAVLDGAGWHFLIVDEVQTVGLYSSLVLGSNDDPHFAYHSNTNTELKYAHLGATGWLVETVVSHAERMGTHASLVLDSGGRPHIAYRQMDVHGLGVAHRETSGWRTELVDSSQGAGAHASICIDEDDNLIVSYYDYMDHALRAAFQNGPDWRFETVDYSTDVGWHASLALDSAGGAHIGYYDRTERDLRYAYHDGISWQVEVADDTEFTGEGLSLAVDSQGHPHMSCYVWTDKLIRYLWRDEDGWSQDTVREEVGNARKTDIVVDHEDVPHIAFYAYPNLRIGSLEAGTWQINDTGLSAAIYSLRIGSNGRWHLAYGDNGLHYGLHDGSSWQFHEVDASVSLGSHLSLTLDSFDAPRISYHDSTSRDLKFAYLDSGGWYTGTADASGSEVGRHNSLAVDTSGNPHVAYYDSTSGDLKYAQHDGIQWLLETVDATGDTGEYASLVLDAAGKPHIAYYDATTRDLMYAWWTEQQIAVDPASLEFGEVALADSASKNVTISNRGTRTLTVHAADVTGVDANLFSTTHACTTLEPGSSCGIEVTFSPQTVGVFVANLAIRSNDPRYPVFDVPLRGEGVLTFPNIVVSESTIVFEAVLVQAPVIPRELLITNAGSADLLVSDMLLAGDSPGEFSWGTETSSIPCGSAPLTLTPGANCSVAIEYLATTKGLFSATIEIHSNDPEVPLLQVLLVGAAVEEADIPSNGGGGGCGSAGRTSPGLGLAMIALWMVVFRRRMRP